MARAVAVPVRTVLFRRWQRGQCAAEIAAALGLPPRTVRHLIRRCRAGPAAALRPAYDRCGAPRPWPDRELFEDALDLRRQHAGWGAGVIRVLLQERWPGRALPSARTLQRWFARAGLGPAPAGLRPTGRRPRAGRPHEVWQLDAVEHIRLRREPRASWLRVTDEFTGAVLHTKVFPIGRFAQVGAAAVQAELRKAFTRWGRPQAVRVDNGPPWGSKGDLPTPLALWITGLHVRVVRNPPRQPRRNAVVERSQGVSRQWVEPETCAGAAELQRRLDRMDRIQRERYPSAGGQSRLRRHPELAHSGRAYRESRERSVWDLQAVFDDLAAYAVPRRVDKNGEVWLYDRAHWVSKRRVGQVVYVTVDPRAHQWVYQDPRGGVIRRQDTQELTPEYVVNVRVGKAHPG